MQNLLRQTRSSSQFALANFASSQFKTMRFALATSKWNFESAKFAALKILKRAAAGKRKRPPRAPTRTTLYKRWRGGRRPPTLTGGPPADRRRARARALSTRELSKSRIFYRATFKSIKVKAIQLVEFGNRAKARLNPSRSRKVTIKTFLKHVLVQKWMIFK